MSILTQVFNVMQEISKMSGLFSFINSHFILLTVSLGFEA